MTVSCSWCHAMNDLSVSKWCSECGHRADLSRMEESVQHEADVDRRIVEYHQRMYGASPEDAHLLETDVDGPDYDGE